MNWIDPLGLLNISSKGNEILLKSTEKIAINNITPDVYSKLAIDATKNANSNTVMLGKYNEKGISYVQEAINNKATYFQLDNWSEIAVKLGENNMWKINEAFLKQQIELDKTILLSHNPYMATGYYLEEVKYLIKLNHYFVKKGHIGEQLKI